MTRLSIPLATTLLLAGCSGPNQASAPPALAEPPLSVEAVIRAEQPAAAPIDALTAFATDCRVGLERARGLLADIAAVAEPRTVANTVVPFDELIMELETSWGIALLIRNVHPEARYREAAEACEQDVIAFSTALGLNRPLYEAFAAVSTEGIDPLARRVITQQLDEFRRAGVDKDEATRERIAELDGKISKVGQLFARNLAEDNRSIVVDPSELAGMPDDWVAAHPPGADGKVIITTDNPDYLPFATYADSAQRRKELYLAFRSRGAPQNDPVLRELLQLRWDKARLLGYRDFADYYIEDKMMKSGAAAQQFIDRVYRLAAKRAKADYRQLLARKRKDVPKAARVEDWEKTYYEEKVKAESYDVDAKEVRQYFKYEAVEDGLLAITSEMYGIEYVPVEDSRSWHEDVEAFDVMEGERKLGRIFLDMHPREGKYGHAAQFPLTPGVRGKRLPEGVLVCNFPNPRTANGAALLEPGQVETMFHEFGHLMHHVFSGQIEWASLSEVERDFVEAPSQMFEEWARSYDTLARFARHHETGAVIPEALVERMRKADRFGLGTATVFQLFYASMVLQYYQRDPATLDFNALNAQLQEQYTPFRHIEGTARHASFGHLHNYPASYYTYMWSLVLAKDLVSPFVENGLMDPTWARRYRDQVLAPGGTKDAADLIESFLGRPYRFDAFEDHLTK